MGHEPHEDATDVSSAIMMIMAILASLVTVMAGPAPPASANTASNPMTYLIDPHGSGTFWFNYDFLSVNSIAQDNVDWATSLMFYGSANINKVKNILDGHGYGQISTNSMHMPVKNQQNPIFWDDDAGKKGIACPLSGQETRHYRIYAEPSTDYLWTSALGNFVVATAHWDANECPPINTRFYDSEEAEGHIGNTMSSLGYFVTHDWSYFYNTEPYRVDGASTWDNDGYATYILVS